MERGFSWVVTWWRAGVRGVLRRARGERMRVGSQGAYCDFRPTGALTVVSDQLARLLRFLTRLIRALYETAWPDLA